ncbi:MAG: hypothetical protein ACE5I9_05170 [Candidatus Methylomirabilales bacterium]
MKWKRSDGSVLWGVGTGLVGLAIMLGGGVWPYGIPKLAVSTPKVKGKMGTTYRRTLPTWAKGSYSGY